MKQGKLTNQELSSHILSRITPNNPETVLGAGVGEDCCAIRMDGLIVLSTDPITAAGAQAGELAIHINANDIASAGAEPIAALVTLLIPPSATMQQVDGVMRQIIDTARGLNIDITGGHTEVTDSVTRMVLSVTMIGKPVIPGKVFKTADMQPGDAILMTKYAGLEGTAIIGGDYAAELEGLLTEEDRRQMEGIRGSLSVVPEGIAAAQVYGVTAMHDITEGGVKGAVCEMCEASGTGAEIDLDAVPVLPVTKKICEFYGIDVYGLISSGSMLVTARNGEKARVALETQGIRATVIGRVSGHGSGVRDTGSGAAITPYASDELYKVIEKER